MESDASYTQNAWGPYKMYGPHTKYATLFTRELCMGGGHSCHDSVARRSCDVRSECTVQYSTVDVSAPKLSTIKYLECENHVSEEFFLW